MIRPHAELPLPSPVSSRVQTSLLSNTPTDNSIVSAPPHGYSTPLRPAASAGLDEQLTSPARVVPASGVQSRRAVSPARRTHSTEPERAPLDLLGRREQVVLEKERVVEEMVAAAKEQVRKAETMMRQAAASRLEFERQRASSDRTHALEQASMQHQLRAAEADAADAQAALAAVYADGLKKEEGSLASVQTLEAETTRLRHALRVQEQKTEEFQQVSREALAELERKADAERERRDAIRPVAARGVQADCGDTAQIDLLHKEVAALKTKLAAAELRADCAEEALTTVVSEQYREELPPPPPPTETGKSCRQMHVADASSADGVASQADLEVAYAKISELSRTASRLSDAVVTQRATIKDLSSALTDIAPSLPQSVPPSEHDSHPAVSYHEPQHVSAEPHAHTSSQNYPEMFGQRPHFDA